MAETDRSSSRAEQCQRKGAPGWLIGPQPGSCILGHSFEVVVQGAGLPLVERRIVDSTRLLDLPHGGLCPFGGESLQEVEERVAILDAIESVVERHWSISTPI